MNEKKLQATRKGIQNLKSEATAISRNFTNKVNCFVISYDHLQCYVPIYAIHISQLLQA
jgi:hypothetical protein